MKSNNIAIVVYGEANSGRDALTEEKYQDLANSFISNGFNVKSVLFNDDAVDEISVELLKFDAVLVWVNPIEQGKDRKKLDALIREISDKGCFVSTHPDVILKMGTKEILYQTRDMDWGGDTQIYTTYEDFIERFHQTLPESKIRVLKQHRGNGGNGVFKVIYESTGLITITHAKTGDQQRSLSLSDFNHEFKPFFSNDGFLIDQEWNKNTVNGMVRCYVSGTKVAGFGYQEINAFYELDDKITESSIPTSKRYYFTQNCGLFSDLREKMESSWVPQLQENLSITQAMMPVIWDADFFINKIASLSDTGKYTLCEINVSCVSPFPPSAVNFIVDEVKCRIRN